MLLIIINLNQGMNFLKHQNIKEMTNFTTSINPFTSGMKPRTFLRDRVNMLKRDQMLNNVDTDYYPKKDASTYYSGFEVKNPNLKGFLELIPWVLAITFGILAIF